MPHSVSFNRTSFLLSSVLLFCFHLICGCADNSCETTEARGEAARASILKYDSLAPNTFIVVPDSLLLSSTRAVESELNELKNEGWLTYALVDSGIERRVLSRPDLKLLPDSLVFYHYLLHWNKQLDAFYIPTAKPIQVWDLSLFGKQYNTEFRFTARHLRAGVMTFPDVSKLYFRQTCDSMFFEYAYEIHQVHPLARMVGMPAFIKGERRAGMPFKQ